MEFTHFNHQGRARMVDVSEKADTLRTATARARVLLNADTYALVKSGGIKKVKTFRHFRHALALLLVSVLLAGCNALPGENLLRPFKAHHASCLLSVNADNFTL